MAEEPIKVVVVDDDALQLEMVSRLLASHGVEVIACESPIGVTNTVRRAAPDVVLLDINIPTIPGAELLELARRYAPKSTQFVFYSSCDESELRRVAMSVDANGWISKTASTEELVARLKSLAARKRAMDAEAAAGTPAPTR